MRAQELDRSASWEIADSRLLEQLANEWTQGSGADEFSESDLQSRIEQHPQRVVGVGLEILQSAFPQTTETIKVIQNRPVGSSDWQTIIDPAVVNSTALPDSANAQLKLSIGCWFCRHQRYDEALEFLKDLDPQLVLAPAALLFHRGLAQHRLLQTQACQATLDRLLENEHSIPRRYSALSRLMLADLRSLEADSLDEISRLMEDIHRRQTLHRSGLRVIGQEKSVIEKLDKMIDEMEKQAQEQASQSAGAKQGSGQAMPDSQSAGGKGSGEVPDKVSQDGGEWGSLPPQKRAAALAEMAKDLPPHYREVIEEYFRQMAQESARDKR